MVKIHPAHPEQIVVTKLALLLEDIEIAVVCWYRTVTK